MMNSQVVELGRDSHTGWQKGAPLQSEGREPIGTASMEELNMATRSAKTLDSQFVRLEVPDEKFLSLAGEGDETNSGRPWGSEIQQPRVSYRKDL